MAKDSEIFGAGGGIVNSPKFELEGYRRTTSIGTVETENPLEVIGGIATTRYGAVAEIINGFFYMFGGYISPNALAEAHKLDLSTGASIQISNMPTALRYLSSAKKDTDIFLCFGDDANGNTQNTLYKFDTILDEYTTLGTFAMPMTFATMEIVGDWLYAGNANNFWRYNVVTNTEEQLTDTTFSFLETNISAVGDALYVYGGQEADGLRHRLMKFDSNLSWTEVQLTGFSPLLTTGRGRKMKTVGSNLCIYGGLEATSQCFTIDTETGEVGRLKDYATTSYYAIATESESAYLTNSTNTDVSKLSPSNIESRTIQIFVKDK